MRHINKKAYKKTARRPAGNDALRWVAAGKTPEKVYITRVFNYGTWAEWRALRKKFVSAQIKNSLRDPLRGQWTKRAKAFAETVFDVKMPSAALISYDP